MEKTLFLTFDDGPNEPYTSRILEVLNDFGAKATFFICGTNARRSPKTLEKIFRAGHTLGNHSYSHNLMRVIKGGCDLVDEIELTNKLIENHTGIKNTNYRSPWGLTMPWLESALRAKGYKIYHWDIMAYDWRGPSPDHIAQRVIKNAFPGAIVLLHDGDKTSQGNRQNTVEALPKILKELSGQGYNFKALPGIVF